MNELRATTAGAIEQMAEAKNLYVAHVTWVHHWTAGLFSFRVSRPQSFRFRSGEFVMIGVPGEGGRPVMRAYSIASPDWEEHLEFFSVKVADGALTSRLQHLQIGDPVFIGKKPTGTLVIDALTPAPHLIMVGTGTGLAPFLSVLRNPETHEKFGRVIITHTVRQSEELAYRAMLAEDIYADEIFGEILKDRFTYYPTVTQGEFETRGRVTDKIRDGSFNADLGLSVADVRMARMMVCGSMAFNKEMIAILESHGATEGTHSAPADFVVERAFVG